LQPQFISVRVDGTLNSTVTFSADQLAFFAQLYLKAINIDTGAVAGTWQTTGYAETLCYSYSGGDPQTFSPGALHTGAIFKLDTTQHFSLNPGLYRLELSGDVMTG